MNLVRASSWMKPGLPLPGAHNADMTLPVGHVYIHHSTGGTPINPAAEVAMLQADDAYHRSKGWDGLGYSFVIGPSGTVYEGRGQKVGAHTEGHNLDGFGVCFLGDFTSALPTPAAMIACAELIQLLHQPSPGFGLPNGALTAGAVILGHRDVFATACPGNQLYANLPNLRALAGHPKENPVPDAPTPPDYKVNAAPIAIAAVADSTGQMTGYLILCADGGIFTFGKTQYMGRVHV